MTTKLTLSMDERVIERAREIAKSSGKSISQMVSDYFLLLDHPDVGAIPISSKLQALVGIGCSEAGGQSDVADYHDHLQERYR